MTKVEKEINAIKRNVQLLFDIVYFLYFYRKNKRGELKWK
jgi:hypothetical protein